MKIILTGTPGIGKTTILQKLSGVAQGAFWIITERTLDPADAPTGYRVTTSTKSVGSLTDDATADAIDKYYSGPIGRAVEQGYQVIIIDEVGELQRRSPAFIAAVDQALNSDATVLVNVAEGFDWTATYTGRSNAVSVSLTLENRDELTGALDAFLSSFRMYSSLPPARQAKVYELARGYVTTGQISSFRKLFQNTLIYLAEERYQLVSAGLYSVRGLTRTHSVFVSNGVWSCDCDLSTGRGKYAGHPAECAHIQTIKIAFPDA